MGKDYGYKCPVAKTLDVIGERWTILILRDLLLHGPQRFQDFADRHKRMGPTTLSARLKTLEAAGVISRHIYERHPPRGEYRLTQKGQELGPILEALRDWGNAHS